MPLNTVGGVAATGRFQVGEAGDKLPLKFCTTDAESSTKALPGQTMTFGAMGKLAIFRVTFELALQLFASTPTTV